MQHLTLREVSKDRIFQFITLILPFVIAIFSFIVIPVLGGASGGKLPIDEYVSVFIVYLLMSLLLGMIGHTLLKEYICREDCKHQLSRALGLYFISLVFFGLWPALLYSFGLNWIASLIVVLFTISLILLIPDIIDYHFGVFMGGIVLLLFTIMLLFLSGKGRYLLK